MFMLNKISESESESETTPSRCLFPFLLLYAYVNNFISLAYI